MNFKKDSKTKKKAKKNYKTQNTTQKVNTNKKD